MRSKAEVLIVVATTVELEAVLSTFSPGRDVRPTQIAGRWYFDLGRINGTQAPWWTRITGPRVVVTLSEMGTATIGGSLPTVLEGIRDFQPKAVIGVGIAFGMDEGDQVIGDVLVSTQLFMYEPSKVGTDPEGPVIFHRGDISHAPRRLITLMRVADLGWKPARVQFGLFVTGEKLIDNREFRDKQLVSRV
ncbi:MAG TPA: hypothetical protein VI386_09095 [Candidatus Sulfotelmatobacter sp.]